MSTDTFTVAVFDDYQQVAEGLADWSRAPIDVTFYDDHTDDAALIVDRLRGVDAVVLMRERTPLPAAIIGQLPDLKLIVTTGMHNSSIAVDAAVAAGITVCGTTGMVSATAELTWALLLSLLRHVPAEDARVRAGGWQETLGQGLEGRTLGVLGLGRIGERVVRVGQAFGMHGVAWSANLTDERAAEVGVERVTKEDLFSRSDIVSVHVRYSERSHGLVRAAELELLGPDGYLINTSRGPIVDQDALVAALREGTIGGAALDVYETEPLPPDDRMRDLPRTVLTPHLGYVTRQNYDGFFTQALEDIEAFLSGEPVRVLGAP